MNVLILENSVQDLISPKCGEFELYFYKTLFDPDEKSKILNHQMLNESTLEAIIMKFFQLMLLKINIFLIILKKNEL